MKYKIIAIIGSLLIAANGLMAAEVKLAQTGFQFLSVVSDAKATAMGEAMTTIESGSGSLFFNPAGMASQEEMFDASFSLNSWIADIDHTTFSLSYRPSQGQWGVFGVSLQHVNYGELQGTMVWANPDGYIKTGMFSPSALALGFGYAKKITDRFSIGAHVKSCHQYLGEAVVPTTADSLEMKKNIADIVGFDFGTIFKTGFKSLAFGMSLKNFSSEVKYEEEGFLLPMIFTMGISMNLMDFVENPPFDQALIFSIDATHPRAHPEQVKVGVDYQLLKMISLRCGYVSDNDESGMSFGAGFNAYKVAFDYAYTPFGVFDKVQKITTRVSF